MQQKRIQETNSFITAFPVIRKTDIQSLKQFGKCLEVASFPIDLIAFNTYAEFIVILPGERFKPVNDFFFTYLLKVSAAFGTSGKGFH